MKDSVQSPSSQFFLRDGLTKGVLRWLMFRNTLVADSWAEKVKENFSESYVEQVSDRAILKRWLETSAKTSSIPIDNIWLISALGAFLGMLTMVGALNYSGTSPVNIWVVVGLFALLPLVMTFAALVSWLKLLHSASVSTPSVLMRLFFTRLNKLELSISRHALNRLLQPWLYWKLQRFALAFQLSAMLVFLVMILFNDIAFGWSSTLIAGSQGMTNLVQVLAMPWDWLVAAPPESFVQQSRFYRGSGPIDAEAMGAWWPYLFMAMLAYGFIPRLLLVLWIASQLRKVLLNEIRTSGDIERFIQVARSIEAPEIENLQLSSEPGALSVDDITTGAESCIAWQCQPAFKVDKVLGVKDWEEDESWVVNNLMCKSGLIKIVIEARQTPTAELADIIDLALAKNNELSFELNLLTISTPVDSRMSAQIKSWQLFARQHNLAICVLEE